MWPFAMIKNVLKLGKLTLYCKDEVKLKAGRVKVAEPLLIYLDWLIMIYSITQITHIGYSRYWPDKDQALAAWLNLRKKCAFCLFICLFVCLFVCSDLLTHWYTCKRRRASLRCHWAGNWNKCFYWTRQKYEMREVQILLENQQIQASLINLSF